MTSLASHCVAWVVNAVPLSGRCNGALGGCRREVPRNFFSRRVAVRRSEAGAGRRRPLQVRALFGLRWPGSGDSSSRRSRRSGRDGSGGGGGKGGGSGLSNPYRALGVTENASYEQIEAAYEALRIKYADDSKQLTKLEILKDRIFDDQLRRRLEGTMEGIVKESPLEKRLREEPRWKSTAAGPVHPSLRYQCAAAGVSGQPRLPIQSRHTGRATRRVWSSRRGAAGQTEGGAEERLHCVRDGRARFRARPRIHQPARDRGGGGERPVTRMGTSERHCEFVHQCGHVDR
eukprot:ctg_12.g16